MADQPITNIKYRIDKNFAANFDELVNIDVANRKSDIGFTDVNKFMIKMRPGTTQIGNTLTGGAGTSKQFFYTDFNRNRWHYRGYNNKLYYLDPADSTWKTNGTFTGNDLKFNTVKLPLNANLSVPTTYISPSASTGAERVKISASDTNFGIVGQGVGKVLIIISDSIYKGAFGKILENSGTEYTLLGSGIIQALESGARYKIYDVIGEYLQVMDGLSMDRYFHGITENVDFRQLLTDSLRLIGGITSSQFPKKQVSFNLSMWTFNKTTLYYSAGTINNPFFHNLTGSYTLPFSGDIVDIFPFKNVLVVGGTNFVVVIYKDLHYEIKSSSFGIKLNSLVDLGDDMYFIATSGQIKSLSEVVSGTTTTIVLNDIGQSVQNYTKNFLTDIASGFDGRKMYMYGQIDTNTTGTIVVFDLLYKIWHTYTGLRPSSIIQEDGITYITSNNTDKVSKFDDTVTTDLGVAIEQKMTLREIDLGDVFALKEFIDSKLWLENYAQDLYFNLYCALPNKNTLMYSKVISLTEKVQPATSQSLLGGGMVGQNILGGDGFTSSISYLYMIKEEFPIQKANIWKVELIGKAGSPFYLNEMDVGVRFSGIPGKFFSPQYTH